MKLYLDHLCEYDVVSTDAETTGLDWNKDRVFGIAVAAWSKGEAAPAAEYYDIREKPRVLEVLRDQVPRCKKVVNHHIKFDMHMLANEGIMLPLDRVECTQVRTALIDEHADSFSLDYQARTNIGRGKLTSIYEELAHLFGGKPTKDVQMKNLYRAPESVARKYAVEDPVLAILLWQWQEEEIERQQLQKVWAMERDLTPVLFEIEREGIRVDPALASDRLKTIGIEIDKAQGAMNKVAGRDVNANSPVQMREMFGCKKGGDGKWYTSAGVLLRGTEADNPSLDKDAMEILTGLGDERAKAVSKLRKLTKAAQFLKGHILGHLVGDRIYPNYNQTASDEGGTYPGRLSIDDPAMQQIPARDKDIAALVRPAFLPRKGDRWGCADWEQFEFRWFAHYANDPTIIEAYNVNPKTDFHQIVSDITGIPRNATHAGAPNAKQINLGLVFGMGEGEMAYQMGLDYSVYTRDGRDWKKAGPRAKEVFATYHSNIPGVQAHSNRASSIARARGFVKTVMERHLRFAKGWGAHKAGGLVLQGSAADCMKLKMITLHRLGKKHGFGYMLSVHDEHNISIPPKAEKEVVAIVKKELETFDGKDCPISCRVPILSSIKVGANWWEASKKD